MDKPEFGPRNPVRAPLAATPGGDVELEELIKLIGPDDPEDVREPITEQAFNDVCAEMGTPRKNCGGRSVSIY